MRELPRCAHHARQLLQSSSGNPAGRMAGVGAHNALQQEARLLHVGYLCVATHSQALQVGEIAARVNHRLARHAVRQALQLEGQHRAASLANSGEVRLRATHAAGVPWVDGC